MAHRIHCVRSLIDTPASCQHDSQAAFIRRFSTQKRLCVLFISASNLLSVSDLRFSRIHHVYYTYHVNNGYSSVA